MSESKKHFRVDEWIAAILMLIMALIAFLNVVSRYFLHKSFAATEEVTINIFVWMTLIGTGLAFEKGGHLGMVSLYDLFPKRWKQAVILLSAFLSAALFCVVDIVMIQTIYVEMTIFHSISGALGIPMTVYYIGVPILSIFVFLGIYRETTRKFKELDENLGTTA